MLDDIVGVVPFEAGLAEEIDVLEVDSGVVEVLISSADVLLAMDVDVVGVLVTEVTAALVVDEMEVAPPALGEFWFCSLDEFVPGSGSAVAVVEATAAEAAVATLP